MSDYSTLLSDYEQDAKADVLIQESTRIYSELDKRHSQKNKDNLRHKRKSKQKFGNERDEPKRDTRSRDKRKSKRKTVST